MYKITNCVKALKIFFILILLSSCNGEFNFNKSDKNNSPIINSQTSNTKDKLEITTPVMKEVLENISKMVGKLKIRHLRKRYVHGNLCLLIILVILKKIKDAKLLNLIILGLKQFIY